MGLSIWKWCCFSPLVGIAFPGLPRTSKTRKEAAKNFPESEQQQKKGGGQWTQKWPKLHAAYVDRYIEACMHRVRKKCIPVFLSSIGESLL